MSLTKFALPALAFAGAAFAQGSSSSCSVAATATISASADAMSIAACPTFTGSVALATGLAGSVSLDGMLEEIDGSLIATGAVNVQTISASGLARINQDFQLINMTQLGTVTFNKLSNVGGEMLWQTLPALYGLTFQMGVQRISSLTIRDTSILDLSGINLKSADNISIGQNGRLSTLSWQLTSVTGELSLDTNGSGDGFNATFGNLATAGSISINSVNSLTMNSLKNLTGGLNLYNTSAESFQFPNLTTSGIISIQDNDQLTNISFPVLNRIKDGGLRLQRNPMLTDNVTFPNLDRIDGDLICTGAFNELLFPEITTIEGAVKVASSGTLDQTCAALNGYRRSGVIGVQPTCQPGQNNSNVTGSGSNGDGSGGTTTSEAAASNLLVPGAVSLGSLLAVMFGLV